MSPGIQIHSAKWKSSFTQDLEPLAHCRLYTSSTERPRWEDEERMTADSKRLEGETEMRKEMWRKYSENKHVRGKKRLKETERKVAKQLQGE